MVPSADAPVQAPQVLKRPAAACAPAPRVLKRPAAAGAAGQAKKLLCPSIRFSSGDLSCAAVEKAINKSIAAKHRVRGEPLRVAATPVQRKHTHAAFQLRCSNCQHGTCTWRATALYDAALKKLHVLQSTNKTKGDVHGQPKSGKSGRAPRDQAANFSEVEQLLYKVIMTKSRSAALLSSILPAERTSSKV